MVFAFSNGPMAETAPSCQKPFARAEISILGVFNEEIYIDSIYFLVVRVLAQTCQTGMPFQYGESPHSFRKNAYRL